jgi:hypothetical protein
MQEPQMAKKESVPDTMKPTYMTIVSLIDAMCNEHLNSEYAELAQSLAAKLARKRPPPLLQGRPETWACAILYALGTVNFLFDKTQSPHMRADELCAAFAVSASSGAAKAKRIRDMLKMHQMDPKWCLPSRIDNNPLIWFLEVNGIMVDIRYMPREIQEIAYRKGLIPYIPADR